MNITNYKRGRICSSTNSAISSTSRYSLQYEYTPIYEYQLTEVKQSLRGRIKDAIAPTLFIASMLPLLFI